MAPTLCNSRLTFTSLVIFGTIACLPQTHRELDKSLPQTHREIDKSLPQTHREIDKSLSQTHRELDKSLPQTHREIDKSLPQTHHEIDKSLPQTHRVIDEKVLLGHTSGLRNTNVEDYSEKFRNLKHATEQQMTTRVSEIEHGESIFCPSRCECSVVGIVDCSRKGLTEIPRLPPTSSEVYLQGNKIEQIFRTSFISMTKLRRLDISNNPLKTLPSWSLRIPGPLRYLAMSGNNIKYLPSDVFDNLSHLVELDLSRNNITKLVPRLFKGQGRLASLNLYRNKLTNVLNDTFIHLKALRFLSLQSNLLRYREATFEQRAFNGLNFLQTLHLHGNEPGASNQVVYPDEALSLLPWLQDLRLDGYSNRPLGPGFSALTNLTHLNFSPHHHQATDAFCFMYDPLPGDFFASLQTTKPLHLSLSNCAITNISEEVFRHLPSLHSLDLSINHKIGFHNFQIFSRGLQATNISVLNISDISELSGDPLNIPIIHESTFQNLKNTSLRHLSLEYNGLLYIHPHAFFHLPHTLETISVHNNFLLDGTFLNVLFLNPNLKTLNISRQNHVDDQYNRKRNSIFHSSRSTLARDSMIVTQVNSHEDFTTEGSIFDLLASQTEDLTEPDFCGGKEVMRLLISRSLEAYDASDINYYINLPKVQIYNNVALKRFDYANNNARCISGPFQGFSALEHFDLSKNYCYLLNPRAFERLDTLKTLLLYDNLLGEPLANDTEGVIFSDLSNLECLDLRNNAIKFLPSNLFLRNSKLQYLDLSHNGLSNFSPNLENATQLRTLDLSYNALKGMSPWTVTQLEEIKSKSKCFRIHVRGNRFTCTCDNFQFLSLLIQNPDMLGDLHQFTCELPNGDLLFYEGLNNFLPILAKECAAPQLFFAFFTLFLIVLATMIILSVYHHKRWQWTYLYYVSKRRLHIGSTLLTYKPVAQVFLTYDQESLECRHLVHSKFLPRLRQGDISHIIGEEDFAAGPVVPSIAGAVVSTHKTLVLFSTGMFEDYHRDLEVNLAIMHELQERRDVLVPVLLLRRQHGFGEGVEDEMRPLAPFHLQLYHGEDEDDNDDDVECGDDHISIVLRNGQDNLNENRLAIQGGENIAQEETLLDLLQDFPPEISEYLIGQKHRCIFYDGGTEVFWDQLTNALLSDV